MITQRQLATLLTSRAARSRFVAESADGLPPGWVDQLEITAGIVAYKRREAVARWFPSTVALCHAVPGLRDTIERFYEEPVPLWGADRRIRCSEALAGTLRSATGESGPERAIGEVLRLETEIVRLTYHPPAEAARAGALVSADGAGLSPSTSVRLSAGARVLRFAFDAVLLWERPTEMASTLAAPPPHPSLAHPAAVALTRRAAMQPVRAVRLGPAAADLFALCAERAQTVAALLAPFPAGRRDAATGAISRAVANGLLVIA